MGEEAVFHQGQRKKRADVSVILDNAPPINPLSPILDHGSWMPVKNHKRISSLRGGLRTTKIDEAISNRMNSHRCSQNRDACVRRHDNQMRDA
jgi:hypothetical protein